MSEHIYHYWRENPEYRPTKFDIVGGFKSDPAFEAYKTRLGNYCGGVYVDADELDNINIDDITTGNRIIAVGGNDLPGGGVRTASTLEHDLRELFGTIDKTSSNTSGKCRTAKCHKSPKHTVCGGASNKRDQIPVQDGMPLQRFSDTTDEILYSCPIVDTNTIHMGGSDDTLIDGADTILMGGSDDTLIDGADTILMGGSDGRAANDYEIAESIDNMKIEGGGESDYEDGSDNDLYGGYTNSENKVNIDNSSNTNSDLDSENGSDIDLEIEDGSDSNWNNNLINNPDSAIYPVGGEYNTDNITTEEIVTIIGTDLNNSVSDSNMTPNDNTTSNDIVLEDNILDDSVSDDDNILDNVTTPNDSIVLSESEIIPDNITGIVLEVAEVDHESNDTNIMLFLN